MEQAVMLSKNDKTSFNVNELHYAEVFLPEKLQI